MSRFSFAWRRLAWSRSRDRSGERLECGYGSSRAGDLKVTVLLRFQVREAGHAADLDHQPQCIGLPTVLLCHEAVYELIDNDPLRLLAVETCQQLR